jgi:septal ring factor EnvC (AmiA/AmiB activator)
MYPIEKYQFKVYEHKNEDGTKSSVVMALSTYAGRVVKGVAKCIATDPFDLEKGKELAAARCDYKVCLKRAKRAATKYLETEKKVNDYKERLRKMGNYFADADRDRQEAHKKLLEIEAKLK